MATFLDLVIVKSTLARDEMIVGPVQTKFSMVVASHYPIPLTRRCIEAILNSKTNISEIIVVRAQSMIGCDVLKSYYPVVTFIDAPLQCPVPKLRLIGYQASSADYVAFIEDDCIINPNWIESVLRHHSAGLEVVGGSLQADNYENPIDWAMFLCEYGRFSENVERKVKLLPGNNTSYKRSLLDSHADAFSTNRGIYEVFLNENLIQLGTNLYFDGVNMPAKIINRWSLRELTTSALHHGRYYAHMRLKKWGLAQRLLFASLALLLPPLLVLRLFAAICRGPYLLKFLICLPQVFLFYMYWSAGEWLGSIVGPGDSSRYWS